MADHLNTFVEAAICALRSYRLAGWPAEAYVLVGREEVAATQAQHALAAHALQASTSALGEAMDAARGAEDGAVDGGGLGQRVPEVARAVGIGLPPRHSLASPNARTPVLGETWQTGDGSEPETGSR